MVASLVPQARRPSWFCLGCCIYSLLVIASSGCATMPFVNEWGSRVGTGMLWGPREEKISASRHLARNGSEWAGRGNTDQAIIAFQQAIQIWPSDPRNYLELAQQFRLNGDQAAAIRTITEGLRYDQHSADLRLLLAESYLDAGQAQAALEQTDLVLQSQRDSGAAWLLRARVLYQLQRYDEALADAYQADARQVTDDALLELLCQIYFRMERPHRAWSIVQRLNTRYPDGKRPSTLLALEAETLYQMNRKPEAMQTLQHWYHDGGAQDPMCCVMLANFHKELSATAQAESSNSSAGPFDFSSLASRIPATQHPGWGHGQGETQTPLATLYPMSERPKFRPLARQEQQAWELLR